MSASPSRRPFPWARKFGFSLDYEAAVASPGATVIVPAVASESQCRPGTCARSAEGDAKQSVAQADIVSCGGLGHSGAGAPLVSPSAASFSHVGGA